MIFWFTFSMDVLYPLLHVQSSQKNYKWRGDLKINQIFWIRSFPCFNECIHFIVLSTRTQQRVLVRIKLI